MKAAILKAPGVLELDDIPDPLCPKGGALLEIMGFNCDGGFAQLLALPEQSLSGGVNLLPHGAEKIIVAERLHGRICLLKRHTRAVVVDPAEESGKNVLAKEIGKAGVDVILAATPEVRVDNDLLKLLSPGGRICIFCGPIRGNYQERIDQRSIHYHELTISGAYGCSSRQNRQAVELLTSGKIRADWLITKRTNLAGIEEAFSHSSQRSGMKSVVCGN